MFDNNNLNIIYYRISEQTATISEAHLHGRRCSDTINMRVRTTKKKRGKKKKMPYYNTADRSSLNSHLNYKNIRPRIRAIAFFNAEWPQFSPLGEHSVYFPAS